MEQVRAFIAIELPQAAIEGLSALREMVQPREHPFVKWVDPGGIHLTLTFLGNVPQERVPRIAAAMEEGASGASPLRLHLGGMGAFPNLRRPRVVWVAVEGDVDRLAALKKGIDQALVPLGFRPEARPFTPHLTLGRVREGATPAEQQRLGQVVSGTEYRVDVSMEVGEVSLMRSRLTPAGAIYSRLAAVALGAGR